MKPHVRYGHTPHSTTAGAAGRAAAQFRRPGGGIVVDQESNMIEEYKLEEQLAPFYESAAPSSAASVRCFLPPAQPPPAASGVGVKPALRTISIMETLSELTNNAQRDGARGRRPPEQQQESKTIGLPVLRRKKIVPDGMTGLLDQWYPPKRRPEAAGSERVWDVSRSLKTSSLNNNNNNSNSRSKARSVQDILSSPVTTTTSTSAHGYGSLERRRRRPRPGISRSGFSARRGETDWEREEDEEEEDGGGGAREALEDPMVVPALFQQRGQRTKNDVEVARYNKPPPPTEWLKKKRPQPPQPTTKVTEQQQQKQLNKERGQTPDWIHKIFHVARRGHLIKLQRAIAGMEPTLVRNLSDHRGNNLLHVLAGAGNADALAWLCSSYGPEMQDALLDENKRGLTPVVAAIQAGRLEALQFLVERTSARERLAPVDGDRSLLHIAAKYGKIDLVAWLAQYMESHGLEVDLRDHCGHSPLHLAARAGHASAVAILVAHGADVTAKNDMGHRPLDVASANGHVGVAQLLRLHDAALCLSSETLEANEELDNLRGDYAELKSYFRDVLVIGKRFAKERDEMCRQLGRLYEDVTSLHQALLFEMRTLHRDLAGVRDRVNSTRKAEEIADRNLDESVAVVESLHEKWQSQQRSWFSSNLADMEHRLLMAEDGWKRLRNSSGNKHRTCQIRPHELLRSRLAAVNAQASNIQCDMSGALSSSEGSLYSGCCQSASGSDGETDALDASGTYGACFSPPANALTNSAGPPTWYNKSRNAVVKTARNESADSVYERPVVRNEPPEEQVLPPVSRNKKQPSRQELRKRLQEVKLTSESGNASVIEVIEPSSSDDDIGPRDQSTPLRNNNTRSFNASFSEELERARQNKRSTAMSETYATSKSTEHLKALAEPDLLAGTVTMTSTSSSRSCNDFNQLEQQVEDEINHSTRSHSSLSSSNATAVTSVAAGPRKKGGGFLTKFALKARWPSKRKSTESPSSLASPTEGPDSPSDLSLGETQADEMVNSTSSAGVVAGLSQMFEDMSTGIKSPSSNKVGHLALANEKRVVGGSQSPSRNSSLANDSSVDRTKTLTASENDVMDLPPSTSPPPVPLEIETYNSSPSSQETSSSAPPPPPRFSKNSSSELKVAAGTAVTPSSSASSSTSASHGGVESLSVAASEDSGIVMARPASSASKSDSSPRPAPSYSFTTFTPLRKASLAAEPASESRLSPAPSDKTESASASDLSKTESMRHFRQLARIEEGAAGAAVASVVATQEEKPSIAVAQAGDSASVDLAHQSGQILTWREAKLKNQVVTPPPLEERLNKTRVRLEEKSIRTLKKRHHHVSERPWYDVSDDESDLLTPERLTKLKTSLSSSDSPSNSSSNSSSSSGEEEV